MPDLNKVRDLLERMLKAEISYGCGWYSDDEWNAAYDELAEMFGFDAAWRAQHEYLHTGRWAHLFRETPMQKRARERSLSRPKIEGENV